MMRKLIQSSLSVCLLLGTASVRIHAKDEEETKSSLNTQAQTQTTASEESLLFVLSGSGLNDLETGYEREFFVSLLRQLPQGSLKAALIADGVLLSEYTTDYEEIIENIYAWLPADLETDWQAAASSLPSTPSAIVGARNTFGTGQFTASICFASHSPEELAAELTGIHVTSLETMEEAAAIQAASLIQSLDLESQEAQAKEEEVLEEEEQEKPEKTPAVITPENLETLNIVVEEPEEEVVPCTRRYTILVLDNSGSLDSEAFQVQKRAAIALCSQLLSQSDVENEIALVSFDTSGKILSDFTNSLPVLRAKILGMQVGNLSNLYDGLQSASSLINAIEEDAPDIEKNIVICSDGLPQAGLKSEWGSYEESQDAAWAYANAAAALDAELKNAAYVYTIGTYSAMEENRQDFARNFLYDLASDGQYYEASSTYFLQLAFEQIASHIISEQTGSLAAITRPVKMEVSLARHTMVVDDTEQISVTFSPAAKENVYYISKNPDVVSVDEAGKIKALRPGEATIIVQAENGLVSEQSVRVYAKYDIRRLFGLI